MWSSRLIIQRSRARSRFASSLASSQTLRHGAFGIFVPNTGNEEDDSKHPNVAQQRRWLSNGRRHGWKGDGEEKPKSNFAEEVLGPAARGELKEKHSSGIPKLAVRKKKGHNIQGELDAHDDDEEIMDMSEDDSDEAPEEGNLVETLNQDISRARAQQMSGGGDRGGGGGGNGNENKALAVAEDDEEGPPDFFKLFGKVEPTIAPDYWKEEEFDVLTERDRAYFRETYGNDGSLSGLTKDTLDEIRGWKTPISFREPIKEVKEVKEEEAEQETQGGKKDRDNNRNQMQRGRSDDKEAYYNEEEKNEPMFEDFRTYARHPESKREPLPFYPANRANPHPVMQEFFARWLYITGLPPAVAEAGVNSGKASKLTVLQQQEIEKTVTRLLGVSFDQVYPANETSAFVGFESPELREVAAARGSNGISLSRPLTVSMYTPSDDDNSIDFVKEADAETILKLENVPPHKFSSGTLAQALCPEGSDLAAAYALSSEKVWFQSSTTVLIRFDSKEQAESALSSTNLTARLEELGQYQVRLFNAQRNVVHDRMEDKDNEIRKRGHRLVVDGDMPSKKFYISHAGAIMLRNLDPNSTTKESLSEFFQPFSDIFRDVVGSVEFVTCNNGLPTDRAYVGFERLGEAEAVVDAFKGRAQIGSNMVFIKLVKDRMIPGTPSRIARPERTEEEILKNLNDWEQYVDPEDIKYLEENGVAKVVIDEALRGMRFHNRSFGPLDWAMRDEKLEPEKESGDDYRELVELYIQSLKDCVATPENPGEAYEGMHFPGEPIDMSIFDTERKRQKALMKKREG